MDISVWGWIGFHGFILAMLALDLGVFHRTAHVVKLREALTWSVVWIGLALVFNVGLYYFAGAKPALEFLTGYLIEKSLSVDNVFIFAILFAAFHVPKHCEHKILFWGVLGALAMRGVMVMAGIALIERFHWLIYVFGGLLVLTGIKMLRSNAHAIDVKNHPVIRLCRYILPLSPDYHGSSFFVRQGERWLATPLFLVLVFVETTDLIFAVDSIPAILAVSRDPFIVFTSNAFAILGLRALYFALAGMMEKFHYLKVGLAAILAFVGIKMMLTDIRPVPIALSLSVIIGILLIAVVASLWRDKRQQAALAVASANGSVGNGSPENGADANGSAGPIGLPGESPCGKPLASSTSNAEAVGIPGP